MLVTPPTAELHVHLEGTLEPATILDAARRNGLPTPAASAEELAARYEFTDLQSFLDIYYANLVVMRTAEDFYAMTDAYLRRARAANVRRAEMFLDPQTHTLNGIDLAVVIEGITAAMADHPEVSTGLIACFLRHLGPDAALAAYEELVPYRDRLLGVGLDSTEAGHPNRDYAPVFARAAADGLHRVAHAGEEGGPDNVIDSLDLLGVERIDHGVRCLEDPALVTRLAADRIPLTVCPQSNVRLKVVGDMSSHPLPAMLDLGLAVSVHSDDPAYFGGYVDDNYRAIATDLPLTPSHLRTLAANSFEAAFLTPAERAAFRTEVDAWTGSATSTR
ncbi:adenosine deaminase [Actinoplanes sp. NPDC051851]|uniref:adenosine deaminase n=1 Tax=Actinoplanes sp. NPDC051851 TaxID=3154753 RepID=UPI003416E802